VAVGEVVAEDSVVAGAVVGTVAAEAAVEAVAAADAAIAGNQPKRS
jgi:hypothetical protein